MTFGQARWRSGWALVIAGTLVGALYAQRPFREYPSVEYGESLPLPRDWQRQAEWTFARLMYPPGPLTATEADSMATGGRGSRFGPRTTRARTGDRAGGSAFDRVDARSVEQAVNLDDGDELYNWPWLYAVQVGEWGLTEAEAKKLRDYLSARRLFHGRRFSWQRGTGLL